ncbi:hypothetical protein D3C80_1767790 [compost metagenome]
MPPRMGLAQAHPFAHLRRADGNAVGRRQGDDAVEGLMPAMGREVEGAVVNRQQPAPAQVEVGLQGLFGLHVHIWPIDVVGTGFHQRQVKGAVLLADLFEASEIAAVTAEKQAKVRGQHHP